VLQTRLTTKSTRKCNAHDEKYYSKLNQTRKINRQHDFLQASYTHLGHISLRHQNRAHQADYRLRARTCFSFSPLRNQRSASLTLLWPTLLFCRSDHAVYRQGVRSTDRWRQIPPEKNRGKGKMENWGRILSKANWIKYAWPKMRQFRVQTAPMFFSSPSVLNKFLTNRTYVRNLRISFDTSCHLSVCLSVYRLFVTDVLWLNGAR